MVLPPRYPNLPKGRGQVLFDSFDAESTGRAIAGMTAIVGTGTVAAANRSLTFSTGVEELTQFGTLLGQDWQLEYEFVSLVGAADESFQLFVTSLTNTTKYQIGAGMSGFRLGIGMSVPAFSVIASVGVVGDIPVGLPVRVIARRVGPTLSVAMPRAGTMPGSFLAITDTTHAGPFYPGFDSYAGAAKTTRVNWLRLTKLG